MGRLTTCPFSSGGVDSGSFAGGYTIYGLGNLSSQLCGFDPAVCFNSGFGLGTMETLSWFLQYPYFPACSPDSFCLICSNCSRLRSSGDRYPCYIASHCCNCRSVLDALVGASCPTDMV